MRMRRDPRGEGVGDNNLRSAVLYARVSSKEQEQGYSIPAQQQLLRRYASELGLTIAHEFVDIESAKRTGRPGFAAMVSFLRCGRGREVVLVEKTDRLYRNLKDYVTMDELDVEIHMVKENEILSRSSRSAQKFMHGIRVLMAKNYIDNLSEEVKKGLHTKAAQNLWPSFAPPGYCNAAGDGGKRIIVPDAVLGPVVTRLFGWFATGEYSLKTLAKKAYEEGFRFRKSGHKIPVSTLHKILRKRIYTGEFEYAGVRYRGAHEPLVRQEVWERVQEILDERQRKQAGNKPRSFAYSGLVSCGHCECSLVGELKKGRYVYYHCTGYRGKCGEPYTREEALERQFAIRLKELVIAPAILEWLKTEVLESDETEQAARAQNLRREQAELERLQTRLGRLYEDRLDGRIDTATYDSKAAEVRQQERLLRRRTQLGETTPVASASDAVNFMAGISALAKDFIEGDARIKRDLLRLTVQKADWKGGELRMSFKTPFEELRLSNSVTGSNYKSLQANRPEIDNWRRGGDSNSRYP